MSFVILLITDCEISDNIVDLGGGGINISGTVARSVNYYIEDVDIFGRVTRHGPIQIDRGSRTRSKHNRVD